MEGGDSRFRFFILLFHCTQTPLATLFIFLYTRCNCIAQAERQAQPSWLWDKTFYISTKILRGRGVCLLLYV
jgi:hypothetical protein